MESINSRQFLEELQIAAKTQPWKFIAKKPFMGREYSVTRPPLYVPRSPTAPIFALISNPTHLSIDINA
jgi:hypothetical protein